MTEAKTPKGKKTRERIIDSSISLINEEGFHNITLNDICRAADVAPGTFYHYFESTNDILKEVLRTEGEDLLKKYETIKLKPALELRQLLNFQLGYFEKKGKEVVAEIYKMELQTETGFSNIDKLLPLQRLLKKIIKEGQISGEFSDRNSPENDTITLMSLIAYYSFRWIISKDGRTLKESALPHITEIIEQIIIN